MQIIAFSRLTPHPIWKQVQMQLTIFATLKGKYSVAADFHYAYENLALLDLDMSQMTL